MSDVRPLSGPGSIQISLNSTARMASGPRTASMRRWTAVRCSSTSSSAVWSSRSPYSSGRSSGVRLELVHTPVRTGRPHAVRGMSAVSAGWAAPGIGNSSTSITSGIRRMDTSPWPANRRLAAPMGAQPTLQESAPFYGADSYRDPAASARSWFRAPRRMFSRP